MAVPGGDGFLSADRDGEKEITIMKTQQRRTKKLYILPTAALLLLLTALLALLLFCQ